MSTDAIVDVTVEAIRRITTDAAVQKIHGAEFPISGHVDCPACHAEKKLFYVYAAPRAVRANCEGCGYRFLS